MKNRIDPFTQFIIRRLLIIGLIFAVMYYFFVSFGLSMGNDNITLMDLLFPSFPPETVPSRNIIEMNNLELLWSKEMNIDNPHKVYVDLFVPNETSVVFWSPQSESLIALDFATGRVLWETAVPHVGDIGLYNDHFYIASSADYRVRSAPKDSDGSYNKCSFAGQAALVAIDATTGIKTWEYSYWGADSYDFAVSNNNIYLTGSNDHGASRSMMRVDATNGSILERDCYRWPNGKELTQVPADERWLPSPYQVVLEEHKESQLRSKDSLLFFVAEGNQLDILDGQTKEIVGSVNFEGAALNPWDIDVAVQGDIVVIYFGDSHQLFGFRLPQEVN